MLDTIIKKFEPVHVAEKEEEKQAVYRFRYQALVQEAGLHREDADHKRAMLYDEDDKAPGCILLYTGTLNNIVTTVRLLAWPRGTVPQYYFERYSMQRIPEVETLHLAEIGPLVVKPSYHGKINLSALMLKANDLLVSAWDVDIAFLASPPGAIKYFRALGARPYGASLIEDTRQSLVPLVLLFSDLSHLKRTGSILYTRSRKLSTKERLKRLPLALIKNILEGDKVQFDPVKIWTEIKASILQRDHRPPILESIPDSALKRMTESGFILEVQADDVLIHKGADDCDMYIILEGIFEVFDEDKPFFLLEKGDLFGEMAFFRQSGKRSASVRALSEGKVLVLKKDYLQDLQKKSPDVAFQLFMNIGRVMAERIAGMNREMLKG